MEYDELVTMRATNPAWRLLRAESAPLVLSVLGQVFVTENVRSISSTALVARLDDELYALNARLGSETFPRSAKAYLDDWSATEVGWLRKYYPTGSDEPHFDATPAVEKAVGWLEALRARSFVGTESRLNTLFDLLRQMVVGAESDPEVRLEELRRRRQQLDAEIALAEAGSVPVLDAAAQRDRYQQFTATARELLSDFREVESNFRALDRGLRERIAGWSGTKGELLDEVLGDRAGISDSDQGKSFQAFYDFLLSSAKQEELAALLERVRKLPAITEPDPRMRHIHYDWLEAGERTQSTVRLLSEQLRRFLDDQVWLENRRVMDILRSIESAALAIRDIPGTGPEMEIDDTAVSVVLPMERPLYSPANGAVIADTILADSDEQLDHSALFDQVYVDPVPLAAAVRRAMAQRSHIGLRSVIAEHPLQLGLAELITYLSLRDDTFEVVFDERVREEIPWLDEAGINRIARLPRVTFARHPVRRTGIRRDTAGGDRVRGIRTRPIVGRCPASEGGALSGESRGGLASVAGVGAASPGLCRGARSHRDRRRVGGLRLPAFRRQRRLRTGRRGPDRR